MDKKGLTLTIIFEAQSLNYDEGFGNLSTLKKLRRGSGEIYTFASRQSLRYSIVKQGNEQFGWKLGDVSPEGIGGEEQVVQFKSDVTIKDCEEIDLFGYMKTERGTGSITRQAVVRLTPAISLEPFWNDIEFLTNKGLADRVSTDPNIANVEQHRSLYKYTVVIDLDRVGSEEWNNAMKGYISKQLIKYYFSEKTKEISEQEVENIYKEFLEFLKHENISIEEDKKNIFTKIKEDVKNKIKSFEILPKEKAERINEFLEVIKNLYRDIRGRREDLKPLFLIGGIYEIKNPFFMNAIKIEWDKNKPKIITEPIKEILNSEFEYKDASGNLSKKKVEENTLIGIRSGFFANEDEVKNIFKNTTSTHEVNSEIGKVTTPEYAIDELKKEINKIFGITNEPTQSSQS